MLHLQQLLQLMLLIPFRLRLTLRQQLCLLWSLQGLRMLIGLAHREALARRLT